jgi:SAM-dependent methyltransferase
MNWTGLAAKAWDPSGGDEPQQDYSFIQKVLEQNSGPALDVGCGTGRILLRLLPLGFDVDGIDTSEDMLSICRAKAQDQGLEPRLYQQAAQRLDLPRRYRVIFIPCGTFCLITDREDVKEALRRLHDHLEPGGLLMFNVFWPFAPGQVLSERPYGGEGDWGYLWTHVLPDGGQIDQYLRREHVDWAEQLLVAQRLYQRTDHGRVVEEEVFDSNERWYFKHEIVLMLEQAGFKDIQVKGDWTDEDFTDEHTSMVLLARR